MSEMIVISSTEQPKQELVPEAKVEPVAQETPAAEIADESGASEAEETEESEEESEETEQEAPKKPLKGFKKRIDKLSKRASLAEAERDALRLELAQAKLAKEQKPEAKPDLKVESKAEGEPNPDDFDTHADYYRALTKFEISQTEKAKETKAREAQVKTDEQKRVDAYVAKKEKLKETHADFDAVMDECEVIASPVVLNLLLDSENGPEIAYHLAKNEEELKRISALAPFAAARELGKFEAKHVSATEESKIEPKKITKAPTPIKPVGGNASAGTKKSIFDESLSQSEYEAIRLEQLAKKRA